MLKNGPQLGNGTCLRNPVQVGRHGFDEHLPRAALLELGTPFDAASLVGKFTFMCELVVEIERIILKYLHWYTLDCCDSMVEAVPNLPTEDTEN